MRRPFQGALHIACSFLLVWSCFPDAVFGQHDTVRFDRITTDNGLSHNTVYAILQDRRGFMWFGTEDGLNRYDGFNFITYRNDPFDSTSISGSWVTALYEDNAGSLWVGTRHRGLNLFDRNTGHFIHYPIMPGNTSSGTSSNWITAIYEDRSGTLWIGTSDQGLATFDRESKTYTFYSHDPSEPRSLSSNDVSCIYEDRSGRLWVGTWAAGLNRFDRRTDSFERFNTSSRSNRIRAIQEDPSGHLWIGTSGSGLYRFDPIQESATFFSHDPNNPESLSDNKVWAIHQDVQGRLWVGTYDGGLNRYHANTHSFSHYRYDRSDQQSLSDDVVLAIYEDRAGLLWIATDRGISKYNAAQERFTHYRHNPTDPNSLSFNDVLAVHEAVAEQGVVWIGTDGGGLNKFDYDTQQFTFYKHDPSVPNSLSHNVVSSIDEDETGTLWIGTVGGGLNRLDPETGYVVRYQHQPSDMASLSHNAVYAVYVDHTNAIWIGTDGGGLNRLDPETDIITQYRYDPKQLGSISDDNIQTIYEDARNTLWIGTFDGGLNRFDRKTDSFVTYRHAGQSQGLPHNRVVDIYEDNSGILWIGTYAGLTKFDPDTEKFSHFTEIDGLASNVILDITGDENDHLWVSTNRGLWRFDPRTETYIDYDESNGLSSKQLNPRAVAFTHTGSLFLGGDNGLTVFRPNSFQEELRYKPPVAITSFSTPSRIIASNVEAGETIEVSYEVGSIFFEFVVLDFANPIRHRFQYMLDDFDRDWRDDQGEVGHVSYSQLESQIGTHTFRVRGANSKGIWNEMTVDVTITPPWWRTMWFRILLLLSFLAVGVAIGLYWYRRQRNEHAEIQRILAESQERERHYLARELHDVPLQNLYSVRHKLEVLSRGRIDDNSNGLLKEARSVVERTTEDLRLICGALRPPTLGPFGLEKALRSHARTIQRSHPNLDISLDLMSDGQVLPEQMRLVLFRIFQGASSNVIRHAQASHMIIRLVLTSETVTLEIEDDGRGFEVPKNWITMARNQHYGMLGISEWSDAIGATLTVKSKPGKGTLVKVVAPRLKHTPETRTPTA